MKKVITTIEEYNKIRSDLNILVNYILVFYPIAIYGEYKVEKDIIIKTSKEKYDMITFKTDKDNYQHNNIVEFIINYKNNGLELTSFKNYNVFLLKRIINMFDLEKLNLLLELEDSLVKKDVVKIEKKVKI